MTMRTLSLTLAMILAFAGCSDDDTSPGADTGAVLDGAAADAGAPDSGNKPDAGSSAAQLRQLAAWMTGGFSSAAQSKADATYYDITLVMKRIWKGSNKPGYWLYVEQSVTGSQPYRQRVYYLEASAAGKLTSHVYDFKNAADKAAAIGAWKDADPLKSLDETALTLKSGCGVILGWDAANKKFTGATDGKKCASSLSGASYATSKVDVTARKLTSWDQGFDSSDAQVWGAVKGPYAFDLIKDMDTDLDR